MRGHVTRMSRDKNFVENFSWGNRKVEKHLEDRDVDEATETGSLRSTKGRTELNWLVTGVNNRLL